MITRCSNCGTPLSHEHVTGIYLKCPNCNREQILSDVSQTISPGSSEPHYYDDNLPWPDFLDKCFDKETLKKLPYGFLNSDNVTTKEYYVPFVEISHRNGSDFMPVHAEASGTPSIPTIQNAQNIKQAKRLTTPPYNARVLNVDPAKTNISNSPDRYVNPELKYFPVKIFSINHNGTDYKTLAVGSHVNSFCPSLPITGIAQDHNNTSSFERLIRFIGIILIIALVICTIAFPKFLPWRISGTASGIWVTICIGLIILFIIRQFGFVLEHPLRKLRMTNLNNGLSNLKSQCKTKTR